MAQQVNGNAPADDPAEKDGKPTVLVGMDAHSRKMSLCVTRWSFGSDPTVVRQMTDVSLDAMEATYKRNVPKDSLTIIEASTNSFSIVGRLRKIGYEARVVYSDILKGFSRKDRINDRIDAHRLAVAYARFGATREGVFVPSERYAAYRDLLFGYRNAVKDTTRISNRIWSFCSAHGMPLPRRKADRKVEDVENYAKAVALDPIARFHLDDLLAEYAHALERRGKFHGMIVRIVARDPVMMRLMQVPGISVVTAFALVAYVEDVHRFSSPSKLVSYVGLNPMVSSSGEEGDPNVLSTYGQKMLKALFAEVGQALVRRRTSCAIGEWARRKIAAGKPYLVMCVAAGRKAIVLAWHIMMGHPAPNRESERMFGQKLMKIYRELGDEAEKLLGAKTSRDYVAKTMEPLYEHLKEPQSQSAA